MYQPGRCPVKIPIFRAGEHKGNFVTTKVLLIVPACFVDRRGTRKPYFDRFFRLILFFFSGGEEAQIGKADFNLFLRKQHSSYDGQSLWLLKLIIREYIGVSIFWSRDLTYLWRPCFQRVFSTQIWCFLKLKFLF